MEKKLITQSTVLKMGFTQSLIKKFLPAPVEKKNPVFRNAAAMKLWYEEDVLAVMETEEFQAEYKKVKKRKESAMKAVEAKKDQLMTKIRKCAEKIVVVKVDGEQLVRDTLKAKKEWYEYQSAVRDIYEFHDVSSVDDATLDRWIVNYIRHNLVRYDSVVDSLFGKTGKSEAYYYFRKEVLLKIADVYPEYTEECQRQIHDDEAERKYISCHKQCDV